MTKVEEEQSVIAERITSYIVEVKGLPPEARPAAADSLLQLGLLDSLGMMDLIAHLEEEFGIEIEDDDLIPENFESIDAIASFVGTRLHG